MIVCIDARVHEALLKIGYDESRAISYFELILGNDTTIRINGTIDELSNFLTTCLPTLELGKHK